MGLVEKWTVAAGAALLAVSLGAGPARAEILLGNGRPDGNCYAGLEVGDTSAATISLETKATVLSCVDGTACDLDGACNGSCTFNVGVCINVAGAEGCTAPGTLESLRAKGNATGVKGSSGKVVIESPQVLEGSVCGVFVDVDVPLKSTKKGDKANKAKVKIDAKAPKGTKPRKDKDKVDSSASRPPRVAARRAAPSSTDAPTRSFDHSSGEPGLPAPPSRLPATQPARLPSITRVVDHARGRIQAPLRPPRFSTRRTSSIVMPRSTALHMS
jgi:hypothetical protein